MDLQTLLANLGSVSSEEKQELLALVTALETAKTRETEQNSFMAFVKAHWPQFISGRHHKIMADAFEEVAAGKCKRLIICMPPRHTKSEFASYLLPAWYFGKFPDRKVIQAGNTADLATGFGRKVRDLVGNPDYQATFPGVRLKADSTAAGHWHTNKGGEYFAVGVAGKVSGKGANLLIIDDPHALSVDTPIPTPSGFVALGDLEVGDYVFGPDGKPTKIVARSDVWLNRELYRVTTSDGESILCDSAHLWSYRSDTKRYATLRTSKTSMLADWDKVSAPCLPLHSAVEYSEAALPIDPWALGVWLGNGTSTLGRISCHQDDVDYFRSRFDALGYETTDQVDQRNFGVLGLRRDLIDAGLLGKKHVPTAYLTASTAQRLALLQGLVDTDGHVSPRGQCFFDNTNQQIVESAKEILHSLGVKAKISVYRGTKRPAYRLAFMMKGCAALQRKASLTKESTRPARSIVVEKTTMTGDVRCITVDRPDGLFLAGRGYVVTHNSEQDAASGEFNKEVYDRVYNWYTSGPRQRLQPNGAIVIVMTRWSRRDLVGQILKRAGQDGTLNDWKIIEFPAILPDTGNILWPEFWSEKEMLALKDELPIQKWNAQYQQNPTAEESTILKRSYWKPWEKLKDNGDFDPPDVDTILVSVDTAYEKTERSNFSAFTVWGKFQIKDENEDIYRDNLILLDAFKGKWEFPELKQIAKRTYEKWKPDIFLVEKKSAGAPLISELRSAGIWASEYTPVKGKDKITRAQSIAPVFEGGIVWAPETLWAEAVIEECSTFPNGDTDDYVDTVTQALIRFRQGRWVSIPTDAVEEEDEERFVAKRGYHL